MEAVYLLGIIIIMIMRKRWYNMQKITVYDSYDDAEYRTKKGEFKENDLIYHFDYNKKTISLCLIKKGFYNNREYLYLYSINE